MKLFKTFIHEVFFFILVSYLKLRFSLRFILPSVAPLRCNVAPTWTMDVHLLVTLAPHGHLKKKELIPFIYILNPKREENIKTHLIQHQIHPKQIIVMALPFGLNGKASLVKYGGKEAYVLKPKLFGV